MARKLTIKQEAFARAYVETGNASEAYRRAYSTKGMNEDSIKREAHDVLHNPNVSPTIEKLKAAAAERHEVTIDSLTEELNAALEGAMEDRTFSAAVSAIEKKAKLHGFMIDRKDVRIERKNINEFSEAELLAIIARGSEGSPQAETGEKEPDRLH